MIAPMKNLIFPTFFLIKQRHLDTAFPNMVVLLKKLTFYTEASSQIKKLKKNKNVIMMSFPDANSQLYCFVW